MQGFRSGRSETRERFVPGLPSGMGIAVFGAWRARPVSTHAPATCHLLLGTCYFPTMDDLDLGQTLRGFAAGQKVFGRYTLVRLLGRGGMGVVWLARDEKLEQDIALKFLPEMIAHDPVAVNDLKRETRRSLQLTHPHIVRIHDFVEDSRLAAVSMEFVDGASLSLRRLEQPGQVFEPSQLQGWVQQLCEALEYAHGKAKIVHRDLKPANLMIDANGDLKVADFGISATLSDTTTRVSKQASSSGTPVYMSPQQMMGEKPAATDDIYSLGATLYELLTGKPPFYTGNVLLQVQNKVPPSVAARREELGVTVAGAGGPGAPTAWEETIAACLAKQPQDRPQSASEVWARLSGEAVGRSPASVPSIESTSSTQSIPPRRRSKLPLAIGLAALLAVSSGLGWYYGIEQPAQRRLAEQQRQEEIARQEAQRKAELERQEQERQAELKRQAELARLEAARQEAEQARKAAEERAAAVARERDEQARRAAEAAAKAERERQAAEAARLAEESRHLRSGMVWKVADLALEMMPISAGRFTMGSPASEPGRDSDEKQHEVRISREFWLGKTEVTIAQWRAVMGSSLDDQVRKALQDDTIYDFGGGNKKTLRDFWGLSRDADPDKRIASRDEQCPMTYVSWEEAMEFCRKLTARERAAGRLPAGYEYTLPTEAQWEYACRAGTTGAVYESGYEIRGENNAPVLDGIAWYGGNSCVGYSGGGWDTAGWKEKQYPGGTASYRVVGGKRANAWGLHDMIGNVFEWCADWYGAYPDGAVTDPVGTSSGSGRVIRGGGWVSTASLCRSALRWDDPGYRFYSLGFRLALSSVP